MTVVIGVVTATVVPVGMLTVAVVIGVLTVTVAATVTGKVGIRSVDGSAVGACDVRTDPDVASPPEPWVDARAALAFEPAAALE